MSDSAFDKHVIFSNSCISLLIFNLLWNITHPSTLYQHLQTIAKSIAQTYVANRSGYEEALSSHGHKDGVVSASEFQQLFAEYGGIEEAEQLSGENFVEVLQTIGIEVDPHGDFLSTSLIAETMEKFTMKESNEQQNLEQQVRSNFWSIIRPCII